MGNGRLDRWLSMAMTAIVAIVLLFPLYWMFVTSVSPSHAVLSRTPPLLPDPSLVNFDAYVSVVARKPLVRWFLNSMEVTVASALLAMLVATLAGYSLSRFRTRGQLAMGYSLLVSRMLPGTLLVIPLYVMFGRLRLLNTPLALILANVTAIAPFSTWMMKGFFDSIPLELEEAAMVDGSSRLGSLARVVAPLTAPGLAATAMYSAILAWSDFLFARTFITSPDRWTVTVGAASFIGEHTVSWSSLMAVGVISIAPIVLIFILLEPFLVSGMSAGAVKG